MGVWILSRKYKHTKEVPSEVLCARLDQLSDYVTKGEKSIARNFCMRIPAEVDHDADLVLSEASMRIKRLESEVAFLEQWLGIPDMKTVPPSQGDMEWAKKVLDEESNEH